MTYRIEPTTRARLATVMIGSYGFAIKSGKSYVYEDVEYFFDGFIVSVRGNTKHIKSIRVRLTDFISPEVVSSPQ